MDNEKEVAEIVRHEGEDHDDHKTPGTFVLVMVLLGTFAVYYFANWKALADAWHVR